MTTDLIGDSKQIKDIIDLIQRIAPTNSSVLVLGENGTGKEVIARAIHQNSKRSNNAFVVQNCSAFNDNLLDSELFGHVKGAFTGAVCDKKGLFEVADGGTFFLDEVGDMSAALQVKLLRVLQEGTFMSVGGTTQKKVDVRIIAATNRDLDRMVKEGSFREDLLYRLNIITMKAPALRERRSDIAVLANYFLQRHQQKSKQCKQIDDSAMTAMSAYAWPGNVRELENEIERMLVLSGDRNILIEDDLSEKIIMCTPMEYKDTGTLSSEELNRYRSIPLKSALETLERELIQDGLKRAKWNKSMLAKKLGISRVSLIKKVDKYKLERRRKIR